MSAYANHSTRPCGSYNPALQAGLQQPGSHHMRQASMPMPTYTHLMQPAGAPCFNETGPLALDRLAPVTLPAPLNADKESSAGDEQSAAEEKGPSEDYMICGIDIKPVLPAALAISTVIGGLCVALVQVPLLTRFTMMPRMVLTAGFAAIYLVTLFCMSHCYFGDPGQIRKTRNVSIGDIEQGLPARAHKSWQYDRPIRRYDHYCKWLGNVIGLLNHREFVVMVGCLVVIAILGIMMDLWLAVLLAEGGLFRSLIVVGLHLGYSVGLLTIAWPILKIHWGLISRNEMAQEWKKNVHHVANNTTLGDNIQVEELDDDEFNYFFDQGAFEYESSLNPFDKGCPMNCWNFWCQPRWPADATGEF